MIKAWLKRNYYRIVYYGKQVKIGKEVLLNKDVQFEGHNLVGDHSEVATCRMGWGSYIADRSVIKKTIVGRYCSIGSYVQTCLGQHPSSGYVSTHPAFFSIKKYVGFTFVDQQFYEEHAYIDPKLKYVVELGNDVWIGNNVLIMDGVRVGDGAIIAAGSIVTKDVEPYAIVAGIPAKVKRYRFTEQQINKLLEVKWWNWDPEVIRKKSHLFHNIESFCLTEK